MHACILSVNRKHPLLFCTRMKIRLLTQSVPEWQLWMNLSLCPVMLLNCNAEPVRLDITFKARKGGKEHECNRKKTKQIKRLNQKKTKKQGERKGRGVKNLSTARRLMFQCWVFANVLCIFVYGSTSQSVQRFSSHSNHCLMSYRIMKEDNHIEWHFTMSMSFWSYVCLQREICNGISHWLDKYKLL